MATIIPTLGGDIKISYIYLIPTLFGDPVWDPGTSQQGEVRKNIKGPLRYLPKWYILYQIRGADRKRRSSVASVLSCSCLLSS